MGRGHHLGQEVSESAPMFPLLSTRYRPRYGEKTIRCTFPGCDKSFYERKNMLQHQTLKHGRPKVGRTSGDMEWAFGETSQSWEYVQKDAAAANQRWSDTRLSSAVPCNQNDPNNDDDDDDDVKDELANQNHRTMGESGGGSPIMQDGLPCIEIDTSSRDIDHNEDSS